MNISILVITFAAAAVAAAADQPFPCGDVPACEDDPTFELFFSLSCSTLGTTICSFFEGSIACGSTCHTCPICSEPEPIAGIDAVVQSGILPVSGDPVLSVYAAVEKEIAGFQATVMCSSDGMHFDADFVLKGQP